MVIIFLLFLIVLTFIYAYLCIYYFAYLKIIYNLFYFDCAGSSLLFLVFL